MTDYHHRRWDGRSRIEWWTRKEWLVIRIKGKDIIIRICHQRRWRLRWEGRRRIEL